MTHVDRIRFLKLKYPKVSLHDNDTVAIVNIRRQSALVDDASKVPIVYLSESLPLGRKIALQIEYNYPLRVSPNYSFIFGVTTCDLSSVQNNTGHVDNVCGNGLNCHGTSKSLKITSNSGSRVKKVTMDRGKNSIRLTVDGNTLFDLDSSNQTTVHPFIILSGSARRIRIVDGKRSKKKSLPSQRPNSSSEPLERKSYSSLFLNNATNWVLSKGIALDNGCLFRTAKKDGEAAYAYLKKPFLLNQEIEFTVTKVDSSRGGSLSIGMTRVNPNELCLDFLPTQGDKLQEDEYAEDWKICLNSLASPSSETNVTLFRDAYGLFIQDGCEMKLAFKNQLHPSHPWHLFFLFSGKVDRIRFLPSKKTRVTSSPRVNAIDFSSDNDQSDDCIELASMLRK